MSHSVRSGTLFLIFAWAAACVPACGSSGQPADAADAPAPGDAQAEAAPDSGFVRDVGSDGSPDGAADVIAEAASDAGADGTNAADAGPLPASGSPWQALSITTGIVHACALLDNHRIKCWGSNIFGCLGTGDPANRGRGAEKMGNALPFVDLGVGRTATAIAAGRYTTCAILDTGAVKCWGWWNFTGEPTSAAGADSQIGNAPGELGDALPALDLGVGRKAVHIASGYYSTCAVLDDGTARCWGAGLPVAPAALEPPLAVLELAPARGRVIALLEDGSLSNLMPNLMPTGQSLVLGAGQKATRVAGSESGVCAVLSDGHLACTADTGWLPPPTTSDIQAIDVAEHHSCVLTRSGDVRCWGSDCGSYPVGTKYWCPDKALADGSLTVALGQPATALGTGAIDFSCALLADGGVKCWTRYDFCDNAAGGIDNCGVPAETPDVVGGAVVIAGVGTGRTFGAWGAIDLGTRP
jgi:hypothetical protein